ncbi:DUF1365 domain-containing protein [Pseudoprimorskyibacter insulae]|uniref:Cyclopropane-fatty-acyl-phospholipid synthase n=1 Tax=Pseudoprimorskyibacter insulae TaxID=1695997 RepID=A0A2R8AUR8_9RHOB|nr:DUF1365 domain-containing protein [Pseudoprimorskyibacter insulae]SPF79667.1 hypothetical protein PRI8871_01464 [Pseudoprimorskyibacter insulae]
MTGIDHISGTTWHGRHGDLSHAFRYSVDYVLFDVDASAKAPFLFSRNRRNLASVQDRDHGGAVGQGRGADWVREVLAEAGIPVARIELLTQPRLLGHVFNPVSFWLCYDVSGALTCVIAEVSNTFGDRHSYLCRRPDGGAIGPSDRLCAAKLFHVSPFQPIEGGYVFRFDIRPDKIGIWIDFDASHGGMRANLTGTRKPLTNRSVLWSLLRRPFGSRRVLALIYWQALRLKLKGAPYRTRPEPPAEEIS